MGMNTGDVALCELDRGVEGVLRMILCLYKGNRYLINWVWDTQGLTHAEFRAILNGPDAQALYPMKGSKPLALRRSELEAVAAGLARAKDLLAHAKDEAQRGVAAPLLRSPTLWQLLLHDKDEAPRFDV